MLTSRIRHLLASICCVAAVHLLGASLVAAQDQSANLSPRPTASAATPDSKAASDPSVVDSALQNLGGQSELTKNESNRLQFSTDQSGKPLTSWMKSMFKDFHPRACRSMPQLAPPSSWPARGEPAIAFCQS